MKAAVKHGILFAIGGAVYVAIELLFRGHSHPTMFVLGGLLFVLIGGINNWFPWEMPLLLQGLIGGVTVTVTELAAGCVLNIWLGLGIWDYSNMPLNCMGQICLPFSIAWAGLAIVAVLLDDWLRWRLFGEDKPHYSII
ncbi:MAG: putative ABC transporter permease [Clostridiales bacterium]|nr:putative ABC transporter permease [Clostridiales bacterium]